MGILGLVILVIAAWFVVSVVEAMNDVRRKRRKERSDTLRVEARIRERKAQVVRDSAEIERNRRIGRHRLFGVPSLESFGPLRLDLVFGAPLGFPNDLKCRVECQSSASVSPDFARKCFACVQTWWPALVSSNSARVASL